jgi:hypothetical protein
MRCPIVVALAACVAGGAFGAEPLLRNFESDAIGAPPAGFEFARTGGGAEGKWIVRAENDGSRNHVLVQESTDSTDNRFPIAVLKDGSYKDVALSVRSQPRSGAVDQGFGLVWRYRDANNYYLARCNALEDNCRIYRVVSGSRRQFGGTNVTVAKNVWHSLKVEATGSRFVVWYDGSKVFDGSDETFEQAGKVGLWTKADSVIAFDDFTVTGR